MCQSSVKLWFTSGKSLTWFIYSHNVSYVNVFTVEAYYSVLKKGSQTLYNGTLTSGYTKLKFKSTLKWIVITFQDNSIL